MDEYRMEENSVSSLHLKVDHVGVGVKGRYTMIQLVDSALSKAQYTIIMCCTTN